MCFVERMCPDAPDTSEYAKSVLKISVIVGFTVYITVSLPAAAAAAAMAAPGSGTVGGLMQTVSSTSSSVCRKFGGELSPISSLAGSCTPRI